MSIASLMKFWESVLKSRQRTLDRLVELKAPSRLILNQQERVRGAQMWVETLNNRYGDKDEVQ